MTKPETGEKAPDFTLVNQDMKPTSLKDHRGHKVALAFYPGAYTGVCKKELCTLRDSIARLEELDAQILAISVNDPFTNKAFHDENDLNFPLRCDYNREAIRKYNVVHDNFAGLKGYTAAKRSVFILNEEGVITYKWVSEDPRMEPDYGELERQLKQL